MLSQEDDSIREGFICPICLKDQGSIAILQRHFETTHTSEKDKELIDHFKGLFSKAKKAILKPEEKVHSSQSHADNYNHSNDHGIDNDVSAEKSIMPAWFKDEQAFGSSKSHLKEFRDIRDRKMDRQVVETNKVVIRLQKLVRHDLPTDQRKRKAYEQSVVEWRADREVSRCPQCNRGFSVLRRRHHCRTCGNVSCGRCCEFLPIPQAQQLVREESSTPDAGFLRRSNSNASITSQATIEGEGMIRMCKTCRAILERYAKQQKFRHSKPPVAVLHEKMITFKTECERILPDYEKMVESLMNGESAYNLQDAITARQKIGRLYDLIDTISKRIASHPISPDIGDVGADRLTKLHKAVRSGAAAFLQERIMGLRPLPTPEELLGRQRARQKQMQLAVQEEQRAQEKLLERQQMEEEVRKTPKTHRRVASDVKPTHLTHKRQSSLPKKPPEGASGVVKNSGWLPSGSTAVDSPSKQDDPLLMQINIIRGYLKQAEEAQKYDEMKMLQQNLSELEQAYWSQRESKSPRRTKPFKH